jgi:hypothetical protein
MKMKKMILSFVFSMITTISFGLTDNVLAKNTIACPDPPTSLTCDFNGTFIVADWMKVNCVDGVQAEKYSVSVNAGYDVDGDGNVDEYREFDFGTGDRIDGDPISDSNLDIPLEDLEIDIDGDNIIDSPVTAEVKVKGLSHHRKKMRQKNTWSNTCNVALN